MNTKRVNSRQIYKYIPHKNGFKGTIIVILQLLTENDPEIFTVVGKRD